MEAFSDIQTYSWTEIELIGTIAHDAQAYNAAQLCSLFNMKDFPNWEEFPFS